MTRSEFGILAEIDFIYFQIRQFHERMQMTGPKTAIEKMIDDATGFADVQFESERKEIRSLFKKLLNRKRKLGFDVSDIEKFLKLTQKAKAK